MSTEGKCVEDRGGRGSKQKTAGTERTGRGSPNREEHNER